MKNITIAPSILACDFGKLNEEIELLNNSEAEWIHFDVMDGVFVPNISFGFPILETVRKSTDKYIDVHLMIVEPEKYINEFIKKGANSISIHYEGNLHLHNLLLKIKKAGADTGVVLNPHTPVEVVENILHLVDTLLIMSVNPGFGGQKFIVESIDKVKKAKELIDNKGVSTQIQVDGGVNTENAAALVKAGASNLVAGSAVFKSENPKATITKLKNCLS